MVNLQHATYFKLSVLFTNAAFPHIFQSIMCSSWFWALSCFFICEVWFRIQWYLWSYRRASYTQQAIPPEAVNSLLLCNKLSSTQWQITAVQCYSSACDGSSWGILLHSSNRNCSFVGISLVNYYRWYDQAVIPSSCWAWDLIAAEIFFSTRSTDYTWNKPNTKKVFIWSISE